MKVLIRADASQLIGAGHVMRCLALAQAWRQRGAECEFISREHPGHLNSEIERRGFKVHALSYKVTGPQLEGQNPMAKGDADAYTHWLGATWQEDAAACLELTVLNGSAKVHWLVIDHYALDARWEAAIEKNVDRLMVIDDLANRLHVASLLLDQNLGRHKEDYLSWVNSDCLVMSGPRYALLRDEFATLRPTSLLRRKSVAAPQKVVVSMGGVDQFDVTGQVLKVLAQYPSGISQVAVVMGAAAPWRAQVEAFAKTMPMQTEVKTNVQNMAEIMADADLAIGAAGTTAWERCCLGLPSIVVVLAENQQVGAKALYDLGAVQCIFDMGKVAEQLPNMIHEMLVPGNLQKMARQAANITDGLGVERVIEMLECTNA